MPTLSEYYGRARGGHALDLKSIYEELGEDWLIAAATGAAIGLVSSAIGGLDKKVFGFPVPIDGVASLGLGIAGLQMGGEMGGMLKVASIAAGGSAAVRTFEGMFRRGFGVTGELEDLGSTGFSSLPMSGSWGFGRSEQDALVNAAKYL